MTPRVLPFVALATTSLLSFACGGSSTPASTSTNPAGGAGSVSGAVVKGPVAGATVTAWALSGGTMGMQLGSGTTDSSGHFSFSIGDYTGPMMLKATGGTYTDEATTSTMPMGSATMTVALPTVSGGEDVTDVQMTPLTTMAQSFAAGMSGGMTAANVAAANADVGSYFSVGDIVHTSPMDPTVSGSSAHATQDMKDYGMTLAAMSQYAKDVGMTDSSGIVTAMMDDASDGVMNGKMGSTSISMMGTGGMMGGTTSMSMTAGTSGLATAMGEFAGSAANLSGLTASDMSALMTKLSGSSGMLAP